MFKRIIKLIKSIRPKSPLTKLEEKLVELKDTDLRNAAEHAYALAVIYMKCGNEAKALMFGKECIALFTRSKLRTEWDSIRRNTVIEGVPIPEIIHAGIVREHLHPLKI